MPPSPDAREPDRLDLILAGIPFVLFLAPMLLISIILAGVSLAVEKLARLLTGRPS